MADPFTTTILKLKGTGFFEFLLPFMLSAAIFYGLLRKAQLFGPPERNVGVNGVVAMVAAFMVWAYPVLVGVSFVENFASFFVQATSAMLVIMVGLMLSGMFFEEGLTKYLSDRLKTGRGWGIVLTSSILIGGGILVTSGMLNIFFPGGGGVLPGISEDLALSIGVMLVLVITVLVIVGLGGGRGGGGEAKKVSKE